MANMQTQSQNPRSFPWERMAFRDPARAVRFTRYRGRIEAVEAQYGLECSKYLAAAAVNMTLCGYWGILFIIVSLATHSRAVYVVGMVPLAVLAILGVIRNHQMRKARNLIEQ